jgi:hypothetical protein
MPIRVKSKASHSGDDRDLSPVSWKHEYTELPDIAEDDSFRDVIKKLSLSVFQGLFQAAAPLILRH